MDKTILSISNEAANQSDERCQVCIVGGIFIYWILARRQALESLSPHTQMNDLLHNKDQKP